MSDSWYDTAQICLNGHTANSMSVFLPQSNKKFCDECGAPTITTCQSCNTPIKGYYHIPGVFGPCHYSPPSFCHNCGKPYPWLEAKLRAAQELSDELDTLTTNEKDILKKSLDDIIRNTPQTPVAATRFKKLIAKAGPETAKAFKDILINVLSEFAKKTIWP